MSPVVVTAVLVSAVVVAVRLQDPGPIRSGFVFVVFALGALSGALAVLTG